jgi:hypothetical protein
MKYTKPQLLNVKKASTIIMGASKPNGFQDNTLGSTATAYRSDE